MITLTRTKTTARKINRSPSGREFVMEGFLEPGLVSYEDSGDGVARLNKETIDKMLPTFIGCPVTIEHTDASREEVLNGLKNEDGKPVRVGEVTKAWWNPDSGRFDCSFTVEDKDAEDLIRNGYSGSCAYNVTESDDKGGELHAMKYNEEILGGIFEHLALVDNPRYEDCKIRMNGKPARIRENYGKLPKGWEVLPTSRRADGSGPRTYGYEIYKDGRKKASSYDEGFSFNSENEALAQGRQTAHEMAAGWHKDNAMDTIRTTYRGKSIEVKQQADGKWIGTCKETKSKTNPEDTAGAATNEIMAMVDDVRGNSIAMSMDGESRENSLSSDVIRWVESTLSNDEYSSDAELIQHFKKEGPMSEQEARAWVAKRDRYLGGISMNGKSKKNSEDKQAMFDKERADHPSFTDEQIRKIVEDHMKLGENMKHNETESAVWNPAKIKSHYTLGQKDRAVVDQAEKEGKDVRVYFAHSPAGRHIVAMEVENGKQNGRMEARALAQEILQELNPSTLSEKKCVDYARQKGKTKIDGQEAWAEIVREMRSLNNKTVTLKNANKPLEKYDVVKATSSALGVAVGAVGQIVGISGNVYTVKFLGGRVQAREDDIEFLDKFNAKVTLKNAEPNLEFDVLLAKVRSGRLSEQELENIESSIRGNTRLTNDEVNKLMEELHKQSARFNAIQPDTMVTVKPRGHSTMDTVKGVVETVTGDTIRVRYKDHTGKYVTDSYKIDEIVR